MTDDHLNIESLDQLVAKAIRIDPATQPSQTARLVVAHPHALQYHARRLMVAALAQVDPSLAREDAKLAARLFLFAHGRRSSLLLCGKKHILCAYLPEQEDPMPPAGGKPRHHSSPVEAEDAGR